MSAQPHLPPEALIEHLAARHRGEIPGQAPCAVRIPVAHYTDPERFRAERERLFLRRPLIVGHESQLAEPGDGLVYDWLGPPLITLRDKAGQVRTFMNVCRHRGMRLVQNEGVASLRSLVCPYHQWTYGLDGALRNVPHAESFAGLDTAAHSLVSLPTEVRHGLIWICAQRDRPLELERHLAGLGADLARFELAEYRFFCQHVRTVECNWKLIQDAFLDGYHVVRLHKKTVGPFFPDALATSDRLGDHIRSAVARNEIADFARKSGEAPDLRRHASFSYTVFPNAVLILHPDYTSIISLFPLSPERTVFAHTMLVPHTPTSEKERGHYERSFRLIDEGVFQAEDIMVSEAAQRGFSSGANEALLFGGLEECAVQFHQAIARELGERT